jgi:hypothetical protein
VDGLVQSYLPTDERSFSIIGTAPETPPQMSSCGSAKVRGILYGLPDEDLIESRGRGEVELGAAVFPGAIQCGRAPIAEPGGNGVHSSPPFGVTAIAVHDVHSCIAMNCRTCSSM